MTTSHREFFRHTECRIECGLQWPYRLLIHHYTNEDGCVLTKLNGGWDGQACVFVNSGSLKEHLSEDASFCNNIFRHALV